MSIIKFEPNAKFIISKIYDEPKKGNGQYGDYWQYTVNHNGEQSTFRAGKILMEKIEALGVPIGVDISITKVVADRSTIWNVDIVGGVQAQSMPSTTTAIEKHGSLDLMSHYIKLFNKASEGLQDLPVEETQKAATTVFIAETNILRDLMRSGGVKVENPISIGAAPKKEEEEDLPF